jgi:ribosomal protein L11 methyltransferase
MFELVLRAPQELVEATCDALLDDLGACSVSVEDADAGSPAEHALFGEPGHQVAEQAWQLSTLNALFDSEPQATAAATRLLAQDWGHRLQLLAQRPLPEQDWVRQTQAQFAPVPISPGFWIVPSWHAPPADARTVLRLDPGMAFGTGTHPTTRMCLAWVARHGVAGRRVLDYGCGSGILAIAAALHGARDIDAVDIDPAAVRTTEDNARANGVHLRAGLATLAQGRYRLVLANILATPLKLLAPLLCAHLEEAGELVLAGILQRQADELRDAYAPWLALQVADENDGWVLMTGRRGHAAGAGAD